MHSDYSVTLRIIDANLNRGGEALRVMEEFARFSLEDAGLVLKVKQIRHELAHSIPTQIADDLGKFRNAAGDVGTCVTTTSESHRAGLSDVVRAAEKRATEAFRAIEEFAKILEPKWAAVIEGLRYRLYDWCRCLQLASRNEFSGVSLYVLITESQCQGDWFAVAQHALDGGADCLQLREKDLSDRELVERTRKLAALCRDRGAMLIVNDRPDIAKLGGAHGVHIGQDDMGVADVRRIVGPEFIVGISTHSPTQVVAAAEEAPTYIAVGPMFPSSTKHIAQIAGLSLLEEAAALTSLPLVAIGGITQENARRVRSTAPCTLCVCGSVTARHDVAAGARGLVDQAADQPGNTSVI